MMDYALHGYRALLPVRGRNHLVWAAWIEKRRRTVLHDGAALKFSAPATP